MSSNLDQEARNEAGQHRFTSPIEEGFRVPTDPTLGEDARPDASLRLGRGAPETTASPKAIRLTKREVEVLILIAEGLRSREIAEGLFLSRRTIDFHIANVFGKLGAGNRIQAIRAAHHMGLIPHDPVHNAFGAPVGSVVFFKARPGTSSLRLLNDSSD